MYEPISVEVYSAYGDGTYRSHDIEFTELLVGLIENGCTTMSLHERVRTIKDYSVGHSVPNKGVLEYLFIELLM